MNIRGYDVIVQQLSDRLGGGIVAYAPALKGCVADGRTEEEALANLQDAIHCWLETARSKGYPIPPTVTTQQPKRIATPSSVT
jgi:predicted RNase H-like HicB family nuclease